MKSLKSIAILLVGLTATNTITPIIIEASLWTKTLANGNTQKIYFFGDRHQWLHEELVELHATITKNAEDQQNIVCAWAKKLNAAILVEDLFNYEPKTPVLSWFPQLIDYLHKKFKPEQYAVTFLGNLVDRCHQENIPVLNIEGRHNVHVAKTVALMHAGLFLLATRFYLEAWQYDIAVPNPLDLIRDHYNTFLAWGAFALLTTANPAYAAYRQYLQKNTPVQDPAYNQALIEFRKALQENEAKSHGTSLDYYWVVDSAALTYIGNNPDQEVIFICAGDAHNKRIKIFLAQQGYENQLYILDKYADASNGVYVNTKNPMNVDYFMNISLKSPEEIDHIIQASVS